MTKVFRKFPSIVQFSGVVKCVRDHAKHHSEPLPKIKFTGSTKLHGTNSGIGFNPAGEVWFQSRERLLSYESDNAGFCTWGEQNLAVLKEIYKIVVEEECLEHDSFFIFGEWFGTSIQKGVAVSQLKEKKFGVFQMVFVKNGVGVRADGEPIDETFEIDPFNYHTVFNTRLPNTVVIDYIVPPFSIEIDFSEPHLVQNKLLELTLAVEEECPVGKYFGVAGVGEGIVWSTTEVDYLPKFKTKGEKHQSSKVTTVHELTEAEITSKANAGEFVDFACTQNRLEQGITKLGEMGLPVEIKSMGAFLKWVGGDILTECHDVLIESKIERKDVMPRVADKARNWYLTYLNSELGLAAA